MSAGRVIAAMKGSIEIALQRTYNAVTYRLS